MLKQIQVAPNRKSPLKITEANPADIETMYNELSAFSMPHPRKFHFMSIETIFVAKSQGKIVGFITILPEGKGKYEISSLYTRLGFDRKGIGSKLMGKANSYLINVKANHVLLSSSKGKRLINGQIKEVFAEGFYRKTNYSQVRDGAGIPKFEWNPIRNPRARKPKLKPRVGLAPQNLLNPLKLRRRR